MSCFQNEGWEDEDGDGDADGGGVFASDFNLEDYADMSDDDIDPDAALDPINSVNLQVRDPCAKLVTRSYSYFLSPCFVSGVLDGILAELVATTLLRHVSSAQ